MEELLFTILRRALGFADRHEKLPSEVFPVSKASASQTLHDAPQPDWQSVIELLRSHALLAVSADAILSLPEEQRPSPVLQMQVMQYAASVTQMHHKLNSVVSEVFAMLHDAGLHPVLLKGQGLAPLYPMPYTRSCGDIDIFLLPEEFQQGCRMIFDYCDMPGESTQPLPNNIHLTAHKDDDVKIEIHYLPADTAISDISDEYNRWLMDNFRHLPSSPQRDVPTVPPVQVNVVYVFEHILKHLRSGGVGLRQFIDWMMLLHAGKDAIDHKLLRHDLQRFHLLDAWQVFGGILVYQFGLPESEFPLWNARKARHSQGRNLEYILFSGNLGATLGHYKGYYYLPPSFRRDILALRYSLRYQRFMYHVLPYDTPRRVMGDIKRVLTNQIKRLKNKK